VTGVIVDTGFLVPLFRPAERLRAPAREFLRNNRYPLLTATPVIVETCFFLDAKAKIELLDLAQSPRLRTLELPVDAYGEVSATIRKYADRDIDLADAALIWLANRTGVRPILTTDKADFGIYRLKSGKRFELVKWSER